MLQKLRDAIKWIHVNIPLPGFISRKLYDLYYPKGRRR